MSPSEILTNLGFPAMQDIRGRRTIADLFPSEQRRTGIYCLQFVNSTFYIGQAIDVVRRFGKHRLVRRDIVGISFQRIPRPSLDERERVAIQEAERGGLPLTNRVHVSAFEGESDLDYLLPQEKQERWLTAPADVNHECCGTVPGFSPKHYARYDKAFEQLRARPVFLKIRRLCGLYMSNCLLAPRLTEASFWSLSCLPATGKPYWPRLAVFNLNWMETFVIGERGASARSEWSFVIVARSILKPTEECGRKEWLAPADVEVSPSDYRAAGSDQVQLSTDNLTTMAMLLHDQRVARAARILTLRLMRKGPTVYGRYHCPQLVNAVNDISF